MRKRGVLWIPTTEPLGLIQKREKQNNTLGQCLEGCFKMRRKDQREEKLKRSGFKKNKKKSNGTRGNTKEPR
jgi:hypothetical protein